MAVEPKRGCGYRKVNGIYLVCPPTGFHCDRLPFELGVCPVCGEGIKFSRGFTWIDPIKLLGEYHDPNKSRFADVLPSILQGQIKCKCGDNCPLCFAKVHFWDPEKVESKKAGLLWVGEKHYTVESFTTEAGEQGISKRIAAIPHGFKVGETWIFLAHKKAIAGDPDKIVLGDPDATKPKAGIFMAFRPARIEKIVLQSEFDYYEQIKKWINAQDDCGSDECLKDAEKVFTKPILEIYKKLKHDIIDRGFTLVPIPDDDPDHNPDAPPRQKELDINLDPRFKELNTRFEKGQILQIYEDPITRQNPEGQAELIKLLDNDLPDQEFWRVRFASDGFFADRWIHKDQTVLSTRIA